MFHLCIWQVFQSVQGVPDTISICCVRHRYVRLEHPCFLGSELAFHTCCIEPVLDGDHHTKESKEDEELKEVQKVAKEIKGIQTMVRNLLFEAQDILPSSPKN